MRFFFARARQRVKFNRVAGAREVVTRAMIFSSCQTSAKPEFSQLVSQLVDKMSTAC